MTLCDRLIAAGATADYATWKVAREIEQASALNQLREENQFLSALRDRLNGAPPPAPAVASPFTPLEQTILECIDGEVVSRGTVMQHARLEGFNQDSAAMALTRLVRGGVLLRPKFGHYSKVNHG